MGFFVAADTALLTDLYCPFNCKPETLNTISHFRCLTAPKVLMISCRTGHQVRDRLNELAMMTQVAKWESWDEKPGLPLKLLRHFAQAFKSVLGDRQQGVSRQPVTIRTMS